MPMKVFATRWSSIIDKVWIQKEKAYNGFPTTRLWWLGRFSNPVTGCLFIERHDPNILLFVFSAARATVADNWSPTAIARR